MTLSILSIALTAATGPMVVEHQALHNDILVWLIARVGYDPCSNKNLVYMALKKDGFETVK